MWIQTHNIIFSNRLQADTELSQNDMYTLGNDLVGAAIAASMGDTTSKRWVVHHREEAKNVASSREMYN